MKARPSFDVARDPLRGHDTWVYRSGPPAPRADRAAPRVEPSPANAAPPARTPSRSSVGWIGTGLLVMSMPVTLTMMALIVPAIWIAGSRRH